MKTKKQYAALPYIVFRNHIEVLLITRRRSKRWIIPKGWPEDQLSPSKLAALEAFEEAGLKGQVAKRAIGNFNYVKRLDDKNSVICSVDIFPMKVSAQYLDFPEKGQRELRWLKLKKAAALIEEKELAALIIRFEPGKKKSRAKLKAKISASL
ncbi:MAG: NUDIX hydrolase [bacterium]|nr:NUDIX hydrolase [bacterium]